MPTAEITPLDPNTTKYRLFQEGKPVSCKEAMERLKGDGEWVHFFNGLLAASPFEAFFWEVRPLTAAQTGEACEFVLVRSGALQAVRADKAAFEAQLQGHTCAASFPNLGKDAMLIVPVQVSEPGHYAHLAQFVRHAPGAQVMAFWHLVAAEWSNALSEAPVWLITSGLGVPWLHVRIDSRPKYYHHAPYKQGV